MTRDRREQMKGYYKQNKDNILEYKREFYKKNREIILERKKKYAKEHKEEKKRYSKQYYQKNKNRINKKNKEYYNSEKGRYAHLKKVSKRDRKLKWIRLIENIFPSYIKIEWHHVTDDYVFPIPRNIHRNTYKKSRREHRELCNSWIETTFDLNLFKMIEKNGGENRG